MADVRKWLLVGAVVLGVVALVWFFHGVLLFPSWYGARYLHTPETVDNMDLFDVVSSFRVPIDMYRDCPQGVLVATVATSSGTGVGFAGVDSSTYRSKEQAVYDAIVGYEIRDGNVFFYAHVPSRGGWYVLNGGPVPLARDVLNADEDDLRELLVPDSVFKDELGFSEQDIPRKVRRIFRFGDRVFVLTYDRGTVPAGFVYNTAEGSVEKVFGHVDSVAVYSHGDYVYVAEVNSGSFSYSVDVYTSSGEFVDSAGSGVLAFSDVMPGAHVAFTHIGDTVFVAFVYDGRESPSEDYFPRLDLYRVVEDGGEWVLQSEGSFPVLDIAGFSQNALGVAGHPGRFVVFTMGGTESGDLKLFTHYFDIGTGVFDYYAEMTVLPEDFLDPSVDPLPFGDGVRFTGFRAFGERIGVVDLLFPVTASYYVPHVQVTRAEVYDNVVVVDVNFCNFAQTTDVMDELLRVLLYCKDENGDRVFVGWEYVVVNRGRYIPGDPYSAHCDVVELRFSTDGVYWYRDDIERVFQEGWTYRVNACALEEQPVDRSSSYYKGCDYVDAVFVGGVYPPPSGGDGPPSSDRPDDDDVPFRALGEDRGGIPSEHGVSVQPASVTLPVGFPPWYVVVAVVVALLVLWRFSRRR